MTKIYLCQLTAEQAAQWLEHTGPNRPIDEAKAAPLLAAMLADKFALTPDALVRLKGEVFNGQHRLLAHTRAKVTLSYLVLESDDDLVYKSFANGWVRAVVTRMPGVPRAMAGNLDLKYPEGAPDAAALVYHLLKYQSDQLQVTFAYDALLFVLSCWRRFNCHHRYDT